MIVTIHQPEFLPWLGFFHRIQQSDVFIVLDDVGYEKNQFNNRNKIKTNSKEGWQYITVPVQGRSPNKKISEVLIDNSQNWGKSHFSVIKQNYKNAPYFSDYFPFFEETFTKQWEKIADLDDYLLKYTLEFLGLKPQVAKTSAMELEGVKTERLVNICKKFRADTYLAGPGYGEGTYMDLSLFEKAGISVIFQGFKHPEYPQQYMEKGFQPGMSIIDLLFNCGPKSLEIIKSGNK